MCCGGKPFYSKARRNHLFTLYKLIQIELDDLNVILIILNVNGDQIVLRSHCSGGETVCLLL